MKDIFTEIYRNNGWKSQSRSGAGSTLEATDTIRQELPRILRELDIRTILDIPCGDMLWITEMQWPPGVTYIGADIVPDIIEDNRKKFPGVKFKTLDITKSYIPTVDLILCRDLLGHLTSADVLKAVRRMRYSKSTWLLATTFPEKKSDLGDIETGQWRPINLEAMRFGLGPAKSYLNEGCERHGLEDKSLGLWRLR